MTCYAMACRRERPCATQQRCEKTWHACTPPADTHLHWSCWCHATWTYHLDTGGGRWVRDPIRTLTGVS